MCRLLTGMCAQRTVLYDSVTDDIGDDTFGRLPPGMPVVFSRTGRGGSLAAAATGSSLEIEGFQEPCTADS